MSSDLMAMYLTNYGTLCSGDDQQANTQLKE
jgi:hypothetical protein